MDSDFRPVRRPQESQQINIQPKPIIAADDLDRFKTPEQVAAEDELHTEAVVPLEPTEHQPKLSLREKLAAHWPPEKKVIIAVSACLVLLIGGYLIFPKPTHKPVATARSTKLVAKAAPKPTVVPSTLTGLPVDPSLNQKPVTGVMIENSVPARPQAGLSQAGVVFEAIAEGGITRFLALFQDTAPADVGPIRSARPYYAQWALGFDAGYAHVGGSPEALANIKTWNVRDLDQFHNGGSYHRISSRAAPHNVYTSIAALQQLEASKGYTSSNFKGFLRKKEAPAKQVTAKSISFGISGPLYNAHFDYDPAKNDYVRSQNGGPHIDAGTNTPITPKVVIAMVIPYSLEADGYHSLYASIGSGQAFIFQDGTVTVGQWAKPDNNSQITFSEAGGKPIALNPGQTWLSAVSVANKVTYSP